MEGQSISKRNHRRFHEAFKRCAGFLDFGYSLGRVVTLAKDALGTIVRWRSGFSYLGF